MSNERTMMLWNKLFPTNKNENRINPYNIFLKRNLKVSIDDTFNDT